MTPIRARLFEWAAAAPGNFERRVTNSRSPSLSFLPPFYEIGAVLRPVGAAHSSYRGPYYISCFSVCFCTVGSKETARGRRRILKTFLNTLNFRTSGSGSLYQNFSLNSRQSTTRVSQRRKFTELEMTEPRDREDMRIGLRQTGRGVRAQR